MTKRDIETTTMKKSFEFDLTMPEVAAKGQLIAKTRLEISDLTDELEQMKNDYKGKISAKEKIISDEIKKIRFNKEWRTVECKEVKNFNTFEVGYLFNGKVMETRAMEERERQTVLKLPETKIRAAKTAKEITEATNWPSPTAS